MSEYYFEVPIRTILDEYIKNRLDGCKVMRLPFTGQPVYDEWIDTEKSKIMFRVFDAPKQANDDE